MAQSDRPVAPSRIGRAQLQAQLKLRTAFTADQAEIALDTMVQLIIEHLEVGTDVTLPHLGTFFCAESEKLGRRVTFRPDRNLNKNLRMYAEVVAEATHHLPDDTR
ncbi:HU family DNA-binding protein [Deinococcus ruber]|uniref:Uncharacterized protein n=1 Tax=Deinococcus ruber TaxID=1848197 RepID=A0A918CNH9_9DEIO|nr:HU family DNA-binding protein [Deinococcus ruber]GGR30719.1 hypothetical protein GCM10008957_46840 [Deinococcus ruber]